MNTSFQKNVTSDDGDELWSDFNHHFKNKVRNYKPQNAGTHHDFLIAARAQNLS
jgi:hypothetical protein